MALELNKKKYLVVCVMVILLNHHINGAIGAGPQAPGMAPQAQAPGSANFQVPNNGPNTAAGNAAEDSAATATSASTASTWAPTQSSNTGPRVGTQGAGGGPGVIKIPGAKPGPPQVPCYFIFGDSLVDAGNNNNLRTFARANYDPYGIDFKVRPGPTGRFSNGKTTVDITAELLGFDHYMPPSEQAKGTDILQGVNFASAAAGIRDDTSQHLGDRITMRRQVENFKAKVGEMAGLLGGPKGATDHLGKCLFQVVLGSNDYLNNYFVPNLYPDSKKLTPRQYADDLIKQYTTHLMAIYGLGARKFALTGVSPVGCTPNALGQNNQDGRNCVRAINDANDMFNSRLKVIVDRLNKDHPDAKFTYIDAFGFFIDLKAKAAASGFKDSVGGCCGLGRNNGQLTCLPGLTPCPNRNDHLFWDAYHPTEATNILSAKRAYQKQLPTDAYPYDIHTLITLK